MCCSDVAAGRERGRLHELPDNVVEAFVKESAASGIDVFRIFDSLNWLENLRPVIAAVRNHTNSLAEAAICYTGDILDPSCTMFFLTM